MKYLITMPDNNYFMWQSLVQINNFKKLGIDKDMVFVVGFSKRPRENTKKMFELLNANVFYYEDTRKNVTYVPTIRPHLLYKYFDDNYDKSVVYFNLDSDVILTKKIKFKKYLNDNIWYFSDTRSYIDSNYIRSKSEELFKEMCNIVNISPELVMKNDINAGGAQYLIKNTKKYYWKKVESDSEMLFRFMSATATKYSPQHPIQAWTAEMWGILWNAWYYGHETKIVKDFDFVFATDEIDKLKNVSILHNAGVTNQEYLFNKGKYINKMPFNDDLSFVDEKYCSYRYVQEILDTKKNYSDLIKLF